MSERDCDIEPCNRSLASEASFQETHEQLEEALEILDGLYDADKCWYDHHGYCQAHTWFSHLGEGDEGQECPHARAKRFLTRHDVPLEVTE